MSIFSIVMISVATFLVGIIVLGRWSEGQKLREKEIAQEIQNHALNQMAEDLVRGIPKEKTN